MTETLTKAPAQSTDPSLPRGNQVDNDQELSFARYERAKKGLGDETILAIIGDNLQVTPGKKELFLKSWLDKVPSDESDARFAQDPERIIKFRDELSDFVAGHLKLRFNPTEIGEKGKAYLKQRKREYLQKLSDDKKVNADFIRDRHSDKRPKYPSSAFEFHGMSVPTTKGWVDLLTQAVGTIRANIVMQREIAGIFVHYSSDAYEEERRRGNKLELTRRIYLNPKTEQSIAVFSRIIAAADQAGITMKGKIWDRSNEAIVEGKDKKVGEYGLRGDGIVLYTGEDADELLGLVEAIYKDSPDAFKGRKVSRVPFRVGEGVAIGDEPEAEGFSLTSHRDALLNDVKGEVYNTLGDEGIKDRQKVLKVFRDVYRRRAVAAKVDPDNIAFNLK